MALFFAIVSLVSVTSISAVDASAADTRITCRGRQEEHQACALKHEFCPSDQCEDCAWGDWGEWSPCRLDGLQERAREVVKSGNYCGKACEGSKVETRSCKPDGIPKSIDCEMSDWTAWSACDKECNGGQQFRTRQITKEAAEHGKSCSGDVHEVRPCNEKVVCEPALDCEFGAWAAW